MNNKELKQIITVINGKLKGGKRLELINYGSGFSLELFVNNEQEMILLKGGRDRVQTYLTALDDALDYLL